MIKMSSIEKKEQSFVNKYASYFKIQFKGCLEISNSIIIKPWAQFYIIT